MRSSLWKIVGICAALLLCVPCFGLNEESDALDSCCSGIYSAMPPAGPTLLTCPPPSNLFPNEPNVFIGSCSGFAIDILGDAGRSFDCLIVVCDHRFSSVYVSRCAVNSTAAINGALSVLGGAGGAFDCAYIVKPVRSEGSRPMSSILFLVVFAILIQIYCACEIDCRSNPAAP